METEEKAGVGWAGRHPDRLFLTDNQFVIVCCGVLTSKLSESNLQGKLTLLVMQSNLRLGVQRVGEEVG